jgi:hypothetical protein
MVEVLRSFEGVAGRFPSLVLIVPGLALTVLGLFVWLGGLGFRRALFAVLGATAGGFAALLFLSRNGTIAGVLAFGAALLAMLFPRLFTALLLGGLSLVLVFFVLARPGLAEYHGTLIAGPDPGHSGPKLTVPESLDVAKTYGLDLADSICRAGNGLMPAHWAMLAAATAGMFALGAMFRSLGTALSCAILGTALIFVGLLLLLIFKGSTPIARMGNRPGYYGLVFAAMALFGTLEQLALCRRAETEALKSRSGKSPPRGRESKRSWRNR